MEKRNVDILTALHAQILRPLSLVTRRILIAGAALVAVTATVNCWAPKAQAQSSDEPKPVAIVAINSIDNFLEDADFVGSLGGIPDVAEKAKPQIAAFTQGLDTSKPMGLVVNMGAMGPGGAICLPAIDLKQMLAIYAVFGVTVEEQADGGLEISAQGQTVYARQADGWAFISMVPEMLKNLPKDPGKIIGELTKDYDIGVQLNVQNIPSQIREMAITQFKVGMDAGMQPKAGESDQQFETRKEIADAQFAQLERLVNELDEVTVGLALDGKQQRAYIDIIYEAVAGTKLAEQVARNSDPKTNFAGFFQPDAAMMLSFASQASESDIAQIDQMLAAVRNQVRTAIDEEAENSSDKEREAMKSVINDFLDAFVSTVKEGVMDGGAVLTLSPSSATFVAGGLIGDPSKVESGFKKLTELAKEEDPKFSGVNWNADSHKDVKFHTINLPLPPEEKGPRQLFGESLEVAVGIGDKSAFLALGRDCLSAVKGVIDTSAENQGKSVAPMEMTVAIQQIIEVAASLADEKDQENLQMVATMLEENVEGRDHVRIVVQPIPNGARTRIEAEEGVLRAIGMAVMQAQMQAAGAGEY